MIKQLAIGSVLLTSAASYSHAEENKPLLETKVGSMIVFGCPKCEPEVEVEKVLLEPGSQFLDVRKVGDDLKVYRTENWLGGSPVSYIHMPSNPDDERFSALEEGPLDMTPVSEIIDIATVASVGNNDVLEFSAIGPQKPDLDQEIVNEIGVIESENIEPIVASIGNTTPLVAEEPTEIDVSGFELRLN